ncbi:MAG: MaoC family dehydratase N-terminal domain-containing protein [Candidatus Dormibacteraeota bacterium]|nr:MaoC family dehydratase N-terminal domain-containing protein [Candidatus Dormibacteraeota bacterium]
MTITVEAAAVYAYTQATGDANAAYPQGPDDSAGKIVPPSYAAVYALGAGSLSLLSVGIEPARLIHAGQEFTWERPIRVGERLTAQGRVAEVTRKRQLQFVSAEVLVTDDGGAQVCRSLGTILVLPAPVVASPPA